MKKINIQKIIGVILCVAAIAVNGVVLYFSADFRASRKAFDKYVTAIKTDNQDVITKQFKSKEINNDLDDIIQDEVTENKQFKSVSYDIKDRNRKDDNYIFTVNASVFYSDDTSTILNLIVSFEKINGKWLISSIDKGE